MVEDAVQQMREANNLLTEEQFELALAQAGLTREAVADQARRNLLLRSVTAQELQERHQSAAAGQADDRLTSGAAARTR